MEAENPWVPGKACFGPLGMPGSPCASQQLQNKLTGAWSRHHMFAVQGDN